MHGGARLIRKYRAKSAGIGPIGPVAVKAGEGARQS